MLTGAQGRGVAPRVLLGALIAAINVWLLYSLLAATGQRDSTEMRLKNLHIQYNNTVKDLETAKKDLNNLNRLVRSKDDLIANKNVELKKLREEGECPEPKPEKECPECAACSNSCPISEDGLTKLAATYRNNRVDYCSKVPAKSIKNSFKGYTLWSNDFHTGPLSCQMGLWKEMGVKTIAKIDYWVCPHYNICRGDLKVIPGPMDGYSLLPCPNKIRREFFNAYKNDPEMNKVDAFLCTHPSAMCELFLPFNRSIIMYEHTRLEFGRNDDNIPWRGGHIARYREKSLQRWKEWHEALIKMGQHPNVVIAANNLYDVHYIKYHTNIDATYIPSSCVEDFDGATYNPVRPEILIGGSRNNVGDGHPIWNDIYAVVQRKNQESGKNVRLARIKSLYPGYNWHQVAQHPAAVFVPYTISTMSMIEYYRLNMPVFLPSLKLLVHWQIQYNIMWERIYGHAPRLSTSPVEYEPNSDKYEDLLYWLSFCDYYIMPHIILYDNAEDLYHKLTTTNLTHVSELMRVENAKVAGELRQTWYQVFKSTLAPFAPGSRKTPPDFDKAMWDLWKMKVGPSDDCMP